MYQFFTKCLALLLSLAAASNAGGQGLSDSLTSEIISQLAVEQKKMFDMWGNGDVETFKALAGEDYLTINADGTYMNKTEVFDLIPKFKGSRSVILEQTDRYYGNLVLSTGRAKFYFGPILAADVYFTQTWIWRGGNWEFIGWQGTMTGIPRLYTPGLCIASTLLIAILGMFIYRKRKRRD